MKFKIFLMTVRWWCFLTLTGSSGALHQGGYGKAVVMPDLGSLLVKEEG
jgi:hypothetical protein